MTETDVVPISSTGGDNQRKTVGYNIPRSKLSGAGWGIVGLPIYYVKANSTLIDYTEGDTPPNNVLVLGGNYFSDIDKPAQMPVLTTAESKSIDSKIDDGRPSIGKVVIQKSWHGNWCSTSDAITTVYDLSVRDIRCTLVFKTGL